MSDRTERMLDNRMWDNGDKVEFGDTRAVMLEEWCKNLTPAEQRVVHDRLARLNCPVAAPTGTPRAVTDDDARCGQSVNESCNLLSGHDGPCGYRP